MVQEEAAKPCHVRWSLLVDEVAEEGEVSCDSVVVMVLKFEEVVLVYKERACPPFE